MTFHAAAIPTRYNGTQFRSRLEARWAAMFDLLKIEWEYEPIDLDGYIPDFVLNFAEPMIVEVKPLLGDPWRWLETEEPVQAIAKAVHSGWQGEGILVGASIGESINAMGWSDSGKPINVGLLFQQKNGADDAYNFYAEPFGFKTCCGGPVDVVGVFHCRRCGNHDKGPTIKSSSDVLSLWREAGNLVQWRGVSKKTRGPRRVKESAFRHISDLTNDDIKKALSPADESDWRKQKVPKDEVLDFFRNFSFDDLKDGED